MNKAEFVHFQFSLSGFKTGCATCACQDIPMISMVGLVLYYKNDSPPVRSVKLCLQSLDLTVKLKQVTFSSPGDLEPLFLKQNPRRCVPALQDGDFILCDSHAINSYLVSTYGKTDALYPKDTKVRALIDQRMYYDAGVIFPIQKQIAVAIFFRKGTELDKCIIDNIRSVYATCEQFLAGRKYIASDVISIADFSYVTALTTLEVFLPELTDYPNLTRYLLTCMDSMPGCHDDHIVHTAKFKAFYHGALENNRRMKQPEL